MNRYELHIYDHGRRIRSEIIDADTDNAAIAAMNESAARWPVHEEGWLWPDGADNSIASTSGSGQ